MVNEEKLRLMTRVAVLKNRERSHESDTCKFKKKDYIALHMFLVWLSSTAAYLMMTGALLIFILGKDPEQYIALDTIGQVALLWGLVYLLYCMVFAWLSYLCYSVRYLRARRWQNRYLQALRVLEEYYHRQPSQEKEDVWLTENEEGKAGRL